MKFYLTTILSLLLTIQLCYSQNVSIDENKSEFPKLKTESLQLTTDIELYPNPTTDFLNITLKNSKLGKVQFEMYNIIGNRLEFDLDEISATKYKINVKDLHSGYYLLIVKDPVSRYNKAFKFHKE